MTPGKSTPVAIVDLATHPTRYVTPAELAIFLEVRTRMIYLWIDKGALAAVKHGGKVRILTAEARRFAEVPARALDPVPLPASSTSHLSH